MRFTFRDCTKDLIVLLMRTEFGLAIAFIFAMVLKFFHIPGGSIILVLSMLTLGIVYFPFAFYFMRDKTSKLQNIPLSMVSGMVFSIAITGLLFKIQHYPGGAIMSSLSFVLIIPILIVCIVLFKKSSEELKRYYRNMLIRSSIIALFTTVFFFVSGATIVKIQYRDDPEYARLLIQYSSNPENDIYRKQLDDYKTRKDSLYLMEQLQKNQ